MVVHRGAEASKNFCGSGQGKGGKGEKMKKEKVHWYTFFNFF